MRYDRLRVGGNLGSVATWGKLGGIVSIQTGQILLTDPNTTATATITAVTTSRSKLLFLGQVTLDAAQNWPDDFMRITLTNSTTITATRQEANSGIDNVAVFYVVEYLPNVVRSVQSATVVMSGVASNTATVTPVDVTKYELVGLGCSTTGAALNAVLGYPTLTDATTVTMTRGGTASAATAGFYLVEYW